MVEATTTVGSIGSKSEARADLAPHPITTIHTYTHIVSPSTRSLHLRTFFHTKGFNSITVRGVLLVNYSLDEQQAVDSHLAPLRLLIIFIPLLPVDAAHYLFRFTSRNHISHYPNAHQLQCHSAWCHALRPYHRFRLRTLSQYRTINGALAKSGFEPLGWHHIVHHQP